MHEALEFGSGLTVLDVPSPRSTIVHRLVCSRLADAADSGGSGPEAYWIDARNAAATGVLYDCAPSPRVLESLRIARAFTAYQHHSLVREATRRAGADTSLIVAPNVASLYRDAELADWERDDLLAASLETLAELGRALDCPVVVTETDDRVETVSERADATIECVRTREGVRLRRADDGTDADSDADRAAVVDETAGYWNERYWQTTIPYWVDCCGAAEAVPPVVAARDGDPDPLEVIA